MWYLAIMAGRLPTLVRWQELPEAAAGWRNHDDDRIACDPRDLGYTLYPLTLPKDGAAPSVGPAL